MYCLKSENSLTIYIFLIIKVTKGYFRAKKVLNKAEKFLLYTGLFSAFDDLTYNLKNLLKLYLLSV